MKLAWLGILFPFVGILSVFLLSKINSRLRNAAAVFFPFLSAIFCVMLLPYLFNTGSLPIESTFIWLEFPFTVEFGILIDPLSIILANVVAVISFIITVYCLGYMKGDPGITRFWMLVNLFIGSMLLLVLANNLLLLFVGWKLVGLCSYGLIGYYYKDEEKYWIGGPVPYNFSKPSHCGLKALVVTGVGDMIMLGGILILFYFTKTLNLMEIYTTASEWLPVMAENPGLIILTSFLLLAGPIGKSAQFPLHEWLPEAMAGPGPVSALIHAATMVKSGVYLVARLIPIFYYGYWVAGVDEASSFFIIVAWVGVITAFVAASQGIVALELKKVLAFSTVSQIGYMWIALGMAGYSQAVLISGTTAGIFHLVNHAVFKACLFLCAGSVIHAAHSIYIDEMGSMKKYMPLTWIFMLIAALCLMGIPPLPGFWSKDAVLLSSLEGHALVIFIIAVISVVLTSFYTVRFLGMVFFGSDSKHIKHVKEEGGHLHEADRSMWGACGVLAVLLVLLGIGGPYVEHLLNSAFKSNLVGTLQLGVSEGGGHEVNYHLIVTVFSILAILIGAIPAYFLYISKKWDPDGILEKSSILQVVRQFLWKRWFIDAFYYKVFVDGSLNLAGIVAFKIEEWYDNLINRILPELVTERFHNLVIRLGTEKDDLLFNVSYVLVIFIGVLYVVLFKIF
ncbi:MAG: NADH-quinone oxidoreductase subunit L [Spirochaetota bacterium]|nr:NADH-quinone oxidoreductase subunit L [Spirochaetota bacterium]